MSAGKKKSSNVAVEQIMRNMTSDMHNNDGQYSQLGFPAQSTPPPELWNQHQPILHNGYNAMPNYGLEPQLYTNPVEPQQPFNITPEHSVNYNMAHCLQTNQMYVNDNNYEKHLNINNGGIDYIYRNNTPTVYPSDYSQYLSNNYDNNYIQNNYENVPSNGSYNQPQPLNSSPFLDNLAGHWSPTNTGTYSPFGNVSMQSSSTIFEPDTENLSSKMVHQVLSEPLAEIHPFNQFNRDTATKKPRVIAEVKPMRPTYSDVLLKSAPPAPKSGKTELKDAKLKKDSKKLNSKNEKSSKTNSTLNRSNTTNEIKDIPLDKSNQFTTGKPDKKSGKTNQLNRKWASLDNVTNADSFSDVASASELIEGKKNAKNKPDDSNIVRGAKTPVTVKKTGMKVSEATDTDSASGRNENSTAQKSASKNKAVKTGKQKNYDSIHSVNERPTGKRAQRNRKRENNIALGFIAEKLKQYLHGWWNIFVRFLIWLFHLISDICSLSYTITADLFSNFHTWLTLNWDVIKETACAHIKLTFFTWLWDKIRRKKPADEQPPRPTGNLAGLQNNINMPTTGEEAMKRLLACKGKDPYSILGVTPTCTDDDIKKYYKRQAFLVHPDKNQQPGAEEAFKILVHAFDMIGVAERREAYDRGVAESVQVEQAWSELTELLAQLQRKVAAAAATIRCSSCGLRHARHRLPDRPVYAARYCATCRIRHGAREGDIWAEGRLWGVRWRYYACMEGAVYDIGEWAACQKESLRHLRADSHHVQYRIALGKGAGGGGAGTGGGGGGGGGQATGSGGRRSGGYSNNKSGTAPDLEHLLNSLYGQNDNPAGGSQKDSNTQHTTGGGATSSNTTGGGGGGGGAKKRNRKVNK